MTPSENLSLRAEPLLQLFVENAGTHFGSRVQAIFKLGSLGAHGDFSLCSDVDVALMLDNIKESDYDKIQVLWDELKASEVEYADRLSIFWSCYDPRAFAEGIGRFPALDRIDLIQCGVLLKGKDLRSQLPNATHEELVIESANFISTFLLSGDKCVELTQYPEQILAAGARYFTKFVLFPVRLIFTLDYPAMIGSNKDSVEHFNKSWGAKFPEAYDVVNQAYMLRNKPANEPINVNVDQLQQALLELYRYCIQRYFEEVSKLGRNDIAQQLEMEKQRLGV